MRLVNYWQKIREFKITKGQGGGNWNKPVTGTRPCIARIKAGKVIGEFVFERD